jgi:hypothetical protein
MSRHQHRTHFLYSGTGLRRTDCGITASRCRIGGNGAVDENEADTVDGERINVTNKDEKVTCGSCRRVRKLPKLVNP